MNESVPRPREEEEFREPQIEPRPGFFSRLLRRDREELNREERLAEPENIKSPNSPDELVAMMEALDARSFREKKLQEKYGEGRLGKIKAFLEGERDFTMDENGDIKRNALNELSRKALTTVFNRKTGIAVGTLAIVGALTGGTGIPAAGALFGSMVGKGSVEAWNTLNGKERGLREEIARSQYRQWAELHKLALGSEDETQSEATRNQKKGEIIEAFYRSSEEINVREKDLISEEKVWNRRRNIGSILGGLAGAGIGVGLSNLSDQMMRMDINGDGVKHLVEKVNGDWHFVYNSAEETAKAASQGAELVADSSGNATHALGQSGSEVFVGALKNIAPPLAKVAAVFGGLWLGRIWERRDENRAEEESNQEQANLARKSEEERQYLQGQIPEGSGQNVEASEGQIPEQYLTLAAEKEVSLPEIGKIWVIRDVNGLGVIKIGSIDWQNNQLVADVLNENFDKVDEFTDEITAIMSKGTEKSNLVNDWLMSVKEGGKVRVSDNVRVRDRLDPRGETLITAGDYTFKKVSEKPNQAELTKEGDEKKRVNIFDLVFWGARPLEEEKKAPEKTKTPKVNEIWGKRQGVGDLPEAFDGMSDRLTISEVDDGVIYFRDGDRAIEDLNLFVRYFGKVGSQGGQGGRNEGQQGGGRGRR